MNVGQYISLITHDRKRQRGASMVELLVVLPALMFTGLGIMQFGLIYHAKSVLNYATFEAARAGAVANGQIEVMRKELGYRLAPVYGGDGSIKKGAMAITRAMVAVNDITATKIEILNPTSSAFAAHGIAKEVTDRHGTGRNVVAIPNSHLRHRPQGIAEDGLTIQDANLLKIQVTYGYQMRLPMLDMEVPGVASVLRNAMIHLDPDNFMYYVRGMIPLKSVATVRMQSESWDYQEDPPAQKAFDATVAWVKDQLDGENPDGEGDECGAVDPETGLSEADSQIAEVNTGQSAGGSAFPTIGDSSDPPMLCLVPPVTDTGC